MIIIDGLTQGSEEWHRARMGIPTASNFSKIVTPTGKKSTQSKAYMHKLVAEWASNSIEESFRGNRHTEAGHENEQYARSAYEFHTDTETMQVGLVYKDYTQLIGCSPDGLVDLMPDPKKENWLLDRGLEIKCPSAGVHTSYLLGQELPNEYIPQVQGGMWVCDVDQWDFISWHENLDYMIITVERDDEYSKLLDKYVGQFVDEMLEMREKLSRILAA